MWKDYFVVVVVVVLIEHKLLNYYTDPFSGPLIKVNICVEEKGAAHINWEPSALLKLPRKLTKSPHKLLFRWTFL